MVLVTLIGEKIASVGMEFEYLGAINDCRDCKLKTVCFNLKPGRRYKITKVRDKRHNCKIHEGTANVVEVEQLPIKTAIDKKYSEGAITNIEKDECDSIGCENYNFCKVILNSDKKYMIIKIKEKIKCPIGKDLQEVELEQVN